MFKWTLHFHHFRSNKINFYNNVELKIIIDIHTMFDEILIVNKVKDLKKFQIELTISFKKV